MLMLGVGDGVGVGVGVGITTVIFRVATPVFPTKSVARAVI